MTCWHLRNTLFPLLWKHVEGCDLSDRHIAKTPLEQDKMVLLENSLYAQCTYLILNPIIGAYVQYVYSCIHRKKAHEVSHR